MGQSRFKTPILAIISCLLWSSAFAGVKIGLEYTTPIQFAGIRFLISGLIVFPLAIILNRGYFKIIRKNLRMILLFAFLQTFLQYVMFYTGISMIPGAVAAIVIGSQASDSCPLQLERQLEVHNTSLRSESFHLPERCTEGKPSIRG